MLRLGTVFSGIGAIEQALKRLGIEYDTVFACDNGDIEVQLFNDTQQKEYESLRKERNKRTSTPEQEQRLTQMSAMQDTIAEGVRQCVYILQTRQEKIDFVDKLYAKTGKVNYVKKTYLANYPNVKEFHQDIRFLDGRDYEEQIDLLVGGSPCQSFSIAGTKAGLNDTRGTLFYEFARIINETKPKVFIYENVYHLLGHDNGNTWKVMTDVFDSLGYNITEPKVLNAVDYGIPQSRRRLFVVGFRKDLEIGEFSYPVTTGCKYTMQDFLEDNCGIGHFTYNEDGSLDVEKVPGDKERIAKYTLKPKMRDYVMCPGTKTYYHKTVTDSPIAFTLLKTMYKNHRAGIDNYITVGFEPDGKRLVRNLTDRECLRLMGFPDDFKIVVSNTQTKMQAGNSIVVDVMMAVVRQILKTGVFENT